MKKLSQEKLPKFLNDDKFKFIAVGICLLQLLTIVLGFMTHIAIGIALIVIFIVVVVLLYNTAKEITVETNKYIADLSYRIKRGEQEALIKMPIGILLFNEDYELQWMNPYLQTHLGYQEVLGKKINEVDQELADLIQESHSSGLKTAHWDDKVFQIIVQQDIRVVYLMDITEYAQIKEKYEDEKIVIGNIFVDNHDEIIQGMNDRSISNLNNFVTTHLSQWAKKHHVYLKRISEDRFIVMMHQMSLLSIEEDKFSIIDRIRERTSKQNFPVTLSMGLAYGDEDLSELAKLAQSNLDLALGRGGDQVVVKSKNGEPRYYGGKTNPMEKRTRVRSRMISQALQELMKQSDQIFIMGHSYPDMDVIGSSLGVRRIAEMNNKEAWIIIDPEGFSKDIAQLVEEIEKDNSISRYIITPETAEEMITSNTLLIMVDHHRPSLSIAPDLVKKTNNIVVIDHHRRSEEFPEKPVLVYIEPYASSTAELVTELFEYQSNEADPINKIEATAMLGGIIVDTKSFSLRTGSRTFDAASYLRSCGADAVLIQRLLKEDTDTYLLRSHLIESIDFISDKMAVAIGEEDRVYDTVVAAQTADTMLSMTNVDAAFVITKRSDGRVGISARSLGEINVQVIMEELGGGGHLSNAATQIDNCTVAEAKEKLKAVVVNQDEGE
ncbi:MAG: DHH family phosphoesterase [Carnobacterium sp.]|uniref:Cyclic-di-AMP phosphodiesterase n=1 Tax=Carnobacterium antarcticum TaxID=2126436 RepID=A0ABW4NJH0_9LACT|nr:MULTISPECIES: DHH family phosphoesterase [unclassified Carnobacterium]ALV22359.1 Phosphoesterase, DHH family protein [Carnobacterium sp. CP1]QQP70295.1 DHH family phosphoesterase [Carnobacterium sp. CS13]